VKGLENRYFALLATIRRLENSIGEWTTQYNRVEGPARVAIDARLKEREDRQRAQEICAAEGLQVSIEAPHTNSNSQRRKDNRNEHLSQDRESELLERWGTRHAGERPKAPITRLTLASLQDQPPTTGPASRHANQNERTLPIESKRHLDAVQLTDWYEKRSTSLEDVQERILGYRSNATFSERAQSLRRDLETAFPLKSLEAASKSDDVSAVEGTTTDEAVQLAVARRESSSSSSDDVAEANRASSSTRDVTTNDPELIRADQFSVEEVGQSEVASGSVGLPARGSDEQSSAVSQRLQLEQPTSHSDRSARNHFSQHLQQLLTSTSEMFVLKGAPSSSIAPTNAPGPNLPLAHPQAGSAVAGVPETKSSDAQKDPVVETQLSEKKGNGEPEHQRDSVGVASTVVQNADDDTSIPSALNTAPSSPHLRLSAEAQQSVQASPLGIATPAGSPRIDLTARSSDEPTASASPTSRVENAQITGHLQDSVEANGSVATQEKASPVVVAPSGSGSKDLEAELWEVRAEQAIAAGKWKRTVDKRGRTYFFNPTEKVSVWNLAKELQKRSGAS
jgi:hypothetical protein